MNNNAMFAMPWYWHLVTGVLRCADVPLWQTDPVFQRRLPIRKWANGILICAMCGWIELLDRLPMKV